jgi:hypothetical protein
MRSPTPELDGRLLSFASRRWRKVARILVDTLAKTNRSTPHRGFDLAVARVRALVEAGALEGAGILFKTKERAAPRRAIFYSEARLAIPTRRARRKPRVYSTFLRWIP